MGAPTQTGSQNDKDLDSLKGSVFALRGNNTITVTTQEYSNNSYWHQIATRPWR